MRTLTATSHVVYAGFTLA